MKENNIKSLVKEDIPKKTVLVLLVMTMVIVALGIWTVLDRMNYNQINPKTSAGGEIKIKILPSTNETVTTQQNINTVEG